MITSKTYSVAPGAHELYAPELSFTTIYGVKRDGTGQTEVDGTPGNREFRYEMTGKIIFDAANPFAPPPENVDAGSSPEKVWVLFNL